MTKPLERQAQDAMYALITGTSHYMDKPEQVSDQADRYLKAGAIAKALAAVMRETQDPLDNHAPRLRKLREELKSTLK